jgi:hypothetical protein
MSMEGMTHKLEITPPTEFFSFTDSVIEFIEEDRRTKLKSATLKALMGLLVDPSGIDMDFETTFFFTFPIFIHDANEIIQYMAEWLEINVDSIELKLCQKCVDVKEKAKHLLHFWARLIPEDFSDSRGKKLLTKANILLASLECLPMTPIPISTFAWIPIDDVPPPSSSSLLFPSSPICSEPKSHKSTEYVSSLRMKFKDTNSWKGTWTSLWDSRLAQSLLTWSANTIAQQLTVVAWNCFESVGPREWLSGSWGNDTMEEEMVPGLFTLVADFNFTHNWAVNEILQCTDLHERTAVLEMMIEILHECIVLQNYHTSMSLFSAIGSSSVERLTQTWKSLSPKTKKNYELAKDLMKMDNNFSSLRNLMYAAPTPLIPYVGIPMGDITRIRQSDLGTSGRIIFDQLDVMARVIAHVRNCQSNPYNFKPIPDFMGLLGRKVLLSGEELYARSQVLEADTTNNSGTRLKAFLSSPSFIKPKKKRGLENMNLPRGSYDQNPYTNRFTHAQISILIEYLNDSSLAMPDSTHLARLKVKIGNLGQGGCLIRFKLILIKQTKMRDMKNNLFCVVIFFFWKHMRDLSSKK